MATLTFTKQGGGYIATLPASTGVVQVKLKERGTLRVYAAIGSMEVTPMTFDDGSVSKSGINIPCKISLEGMDKVLVSVDKEVEAAQFVEA